ncbi:hypothetical protein FD754_015122 [Muntiacus muntjak]|uniref:small monomeric GTPase n=1 Tax=Muntiacus muntjak TaxID=9888 RepID=A0A5N3VPF0_MUNMU|nr:hypothetical protein FD754_015122 [Muntiacus muntjak]
MASAQDARYGQKDSSDQNFDYMFKLLIIGNSSVGKTSFLFRYADDSFTSAFVSTVGIDFKVKTVFKNEKRIKLQIWVTSLWVLLCHFSNAQNSSLCVNQDRVFQPFHPLLSLLLLPSIFPSIRVFSNELALHIRIFETSSVRAGSFVCLFNAMKNILEDNCI